MVNVFELKCLLWEQRTYREIAHQLLHDWFDSPKNIAVAIHESLIHALKSDCSIVSWICHYCAAFIPSILLPVQTTIQICNAGIKTIHNFQIFYLKMKTDFLEQPQSALVYAGGMYMYSNIFWFTTVL